LTETQDLIDIRRQIQTPPTIGIILGSGLGAFSDALTSEFVLPASRLDGYPAATVAGHSGNLLFGRIGATGVAILQGRLHFYEGFSPTQVLLPLRLFIALGIKSLLVTNAAGAVNPDYRPGDLMVIKDHINFFRGPNQRPDADVKPMRHYYDSAYQQLLLSCVAKQPGSSHLGTLFSWLGPSYETAAEVRMIARLGADVANMSTVAEVEYAAAAGLRVAGISCISNMAAGLQEQRLSHSEVTAAAERVAPVFRAVLIAFIKLLEEAP
jgi:purine-nucleoside phosphorylase